MLELSKSWELVVNKITEWLDLLFYNLPNAILAIIIMAISFWISSRLRPSIRKIIDRLVPEVALQQFLTRSVGMLIVLIGFLLAISVLNLDGLLKSLLAGAGVAGLAVGLALQGILSNTFSGIVLAVKNVINIGDWVVSNGYEGTVEQITMRNTILREADNNFVIIPNKMILDQPFKNYGLTKQVRVLLNCGVSYNEDLEHVKQIALAAICHHFKNVNEKDMEFYYRSFGDSSIDFQLRFWVNATESLSILEAQSKAIMVIKSAFDEAGISIPFPMRTLEWARGHEFPRPDNV